MSSDYLSTFLVLLLFAGTSFFVLYRTRRFRTWAVALVIFSTTATVLGIYMKHDTVTEKNAFSALPNPFTDKVKCDLFSTEEKFCEREVTYYGYPVPVLQKYKTDTFNNDTKEVTSSVGLRYSNLAINYFAFLFPSLLGVYLLQTLRKPIKHNKK